MGPFVVTFDRACVANELTPFSFAAFVSSLIAKVWCMVARRKRFFIVDATISSKTNNYII
jgi:NADH:ubiquinone oxidoreductase subunit B-like Fe-S oxidoreductase